EPARGRRARDLDGLVARRAAPTRDGRAGADVVDLADPHRADAIRRDARRPAAELALVAAVLFRLQLRNAHLGCRHRFLIVVAHRPAPTSIGAFTRLPHSV